MSKLAYSLLLSLLLVSSTEAADRFPVGVPVETQALFCLEQNDAQVIADAKGDLTPEVRVLVVSGKCRQLSGVAIYVKEVYRNGEWAVWELKSGNIPAFYEATDWKPIPKGIEI